MNKTDLKKELERASHCLEENELDEAARLCTAVLHVAPQNACAFHLRAIASQRGGRGKEATEDAVKAASLRPDLPALQLAAGSLLCREKFYDRALELYEAALRKDPGKAQYHLGAASALRKLGRGDEATCALRKAADAAAAAAATAAGLGGSGVEAQAQYKLGQHLRSTGDPHEAAEAYARCLELDPGHVLAAFWLTATRKLAASAAPEPHRDGSSSEVGHATSGGNRGRGRAVSPSHGRRATAVERPPRTPPAPAAAPREYVVGLYNGYAETFDSHLQGSLAYRTPAVIVETLRVLFPGRRWRRCLDLGAGTGLSGQAASIVCDHLVGVDLSPAMVRRAREKRVYQRLLVGDVTETVERLCRESRAAIASASEAETGAEAKAGGGCGSGFGLLPCSSSVLARGWEVPATAEEEGGAVVGAGGSGDRSFKGHCQIGAAGTVAGAAAAAAGTGAAAAKSGGRTDVAGNGAEAGAPTTPPSEMAPNPSHGSDGPARSSPAAHAGASSSDRAGEGGGELVLSCDVFGYIGNLRPCFAAVRELLAIGESCPSAAGRRAILRAKAAATTSPESWGEFAPVFAFSAEAPPAVAETTRGSGIEERAAGDPAGGSTPGYELQGTGRYSHSREYLGRVCRETGFRVLVADDVVLRKNAGVPVKGFVFVTEAVLPSAPAS